MKNKDNFMKKKYRISNEMREIIKIREFRKFILENLKKKYPKYYIDMGYNDPEGCASFIYANIYNVPENLVEKVTEYILDLDNEIRNTKYKGLSLIPMIHNKEVTKKHYPEILNSKEKQS